MLLNVCERRTTGYTWNPNFSYNVDLIWFQWLLWAKWNVQSGEWFHVWDRSIAIISCSLGKMMRMVFCFFHTHSSFIRCLVFGWITGMNAMTITTVVKNHTPKSRWHVNYKIWINTLFFSAFFLVISHRNHRNRSMGK